MSLGTCTTEPKVQLFNGSGGQACLICGYRPRGKKHRQMLRAVCGSGQERLASVVCCDQCTEPALARAKEIAEEKLLHPV